MGTKRRTADGEPTEGAKAVREPRMLARVVAEYFLTVVGVALGLGAAFGWAIYQKLDMGAEVPTALYLYCGAALLVAAVMGAARLALADEVRTAQLRKHLAADARALLKEADTLLKKNPPKERADEVGEAAAAVARAREAEDWDALGDSVTTLDALLDKLLGGDRKSTAREYIESIVFAVLIALVLRAFVIEAFKIPSGSMIPTLQVGDHIFVNKFIYGVRVPWTNVKFGMDVRKPQRGEVVVFKFPHDEEKDFIKRIIAIEGDTVEIRDNVVYVNDQPVPREHISGVPCEYEDFSEEYNKWEHRRCDAYKETHGGHSYTTIYERGKMPASFKKHTIEPANVFVLGDNRDNSHDSRYWGTVPFKLLKGKAMIIWWSQGEPEGVRVKRMGKLIE